MHLSTLDEAEVELGYIYYKKLFRLQVEQSFKFQDYDKEACQLSLTDHTVARMLKAGMHEDEVNELCVGTVEEQAISMLSLISDRDLARSTGPYHMTAAVSDNGVHGGGEGGDGGGCV
eukprot:1801878-Karenia_brevis.AAC.1